MLREHTSHGRQIDLIEKSFYDRPFSATADNVLLRSFTQDELKSTDENRFTCSRLARNDVEAGTEADLQILNEGVVRNVEGTKH